MTGQPTDGNVLKRSGPLAALLLVLALHPRGAWATAELHVDPDRQTPWDNCTACHGDDLQGGLAGVACTRCHNAFQPPDAPAPGHHMPDRMVPESYCVTCHGRRLQGGPGPSCFSCHDQLWPSGQDAGGGGDGGGDGGGGGGNSPPQVDPGGPYAGQPGQPILFDASGTVDPDGDPLTFLWSFGDGSFPSLPSSSPTAEHTYAEPGVYTVLLTVMDGVNAPVLVEVEAAITAAENAPPLADAGGPYEGVAGQPVALDGSLSSDPDGDPLTYEWDFGDGTTSGPNASPAASHVYAAAGTYTVVLRVSDGVNSPVEAQTTVEVLDAGGGPPPGLLDHRWILRLPLVPASGEVSFQSYGGLLLVETVFDGQASSGLGIASDGYVLWFDASGAVFLGQLDGARMHGLAYNFRGANTAWLAEQAEQDAPGVDALLGSLLDGLL